MGRAATRDKGATLYEPRAKPRGPDQKSPGLGHRTDPAPHCPCAPGARVRIYELDREFPVWLWLCRKCLGRRLKRNFQVKTNRTPAFADLPCQDCP